MIQHPLTYGIKDVCATIFWLNDCDGVPNPDEEPLLACNLSSATLRKTVEDGEEQEAPNPSATTGKRCLYDSSEPTPGPCYLDYLTCGLEIPKLWAWLNLEAPIIDPDTGAICGFEEITSEIAKCQACGKATAACKSQVSVATFHNAWCGEERHPIYPYVVNFYPGAKAELLENEIEYGQGFTSFRSFSLRLKSNPNFVDPWGIMVDENGDPSGTNSKYVQKLVECPPGSPIEELVDLACACIYCDSATEKTDITENVVNAQTDTELV